MSTATPDGPSGEEPRWIHEVSEQVAARLRPFVSTAKEFVFHPVRFAKRWGNGEAFAMNPLWFAASAVAVMTTVQSGLEELLGVRGNHGVFENVRRALGPYLYYVEIGVAAHAFLWLTGSRRRLSSSIAMSLYAGGTMATLGQLLVIGAIAVSTLLYGPQWINGGEISDGLQIALTILLTLSFAAFYTVFASSMGSLHKSSFLRMFGANGFALFVSSVISEYVPLPTLHVALRLRDAGHWVFSFHVRTGF